MHDGVTSSDRRAARKQARREHRAARTRAQALSPGRILSLLLSLPLITAATMVGVYVRTSDYPPSEAVMHLVAMTGCPATAYVGLAPARAGMPGYHARNDADGDGVACDSARTAPALPDVAAGPVPAAPGAAPRRMTGGAKFVRP